jgi:hypothetical protein
VILGVVDGVDTNGVDSEVGKVGNVTLADVGISEGIRVSSGATGLVVDSTQVEALLAGPEG